MSLLLHEFHHGLGARFAGLNGAEVVNDYGDWLAEHAAMHQTAGVLDLSFRSRICLTGADRSRFLHGQVTNDVKKLRVGGGGYAAMTTNKGKMESDLNIFCLADELLLDFEPGLTEKISQRLEKFIVADAVQIADVAPHYGLLRVQGPKAEAVVRALGLIGWGEQPVPPCGDTREPGTDTGGSSAASPHQFPTEAFASVKVSDATLGEIYLMNLERLAGSAGFDLFIPNASLGAVADKLMAAAKQIGGRACGWQAFETARIEAGIPRFGADMDETNLPLECGPALRDAISYKKGCYIGQEVINRIHSVGHVNKELRGLRLANDLKSLPQRGDKLFREDKEVGYVTSAVKSPTSGNIALSYVRREANQIGTELVLQTAAVESSAKIVELPFGK